MSGWIGLMIFFFALYLVARSRKRRAQQRETQRREDGADWSFTRSGRQDHLNKRREENRG